MVRMPTGVGGVAGAMGAGGAGVEFAGADGGQDFGQLLDAAVRGVDAKQIDADAMLRGIASGENVDMHGTMIALEEANIALRTMGSVRDKMVEGWQAIWNMPV
jgi:flagellar hook-basal body complex protein FliE